MDNTTLLVVAREWWIRNGWNPATWDCFPLRQQFAIALKARAQGWPIRERSNEGRNWQQLSLF